MGFELSRRRLPVTTLASGSELALEIREYRGRAGDGPRVGLCAAIHGDEPTGWYILYRFLQELSQLDFRGSIVVLPVANPLAFAGRSRHTPIDSLNLNRVFPGDDGGWVSEKLAAAIVRDFLPEIDLLVDFHAGGGLATVDYVYIHNDEALSRAFGSPVLYLPDETRQGTLFSGTIGTVAIEHGIPVVTVELGGGTVEQRRYIEQGVSGLLNVLRYAGTLDGDVVYPQEQTVVREIVTLRPFHGGVLWPEATELGARLRRDAVLGRIVDPLSMDDVEVMRCPFDVGVLILAHLTPNVVQPGDYGYMIGKIDEGGAGNAA